MRAKLGVIFCYLHLISNLKIAEKTVSVSKNMLFHNLTFTREEECVTKLCIKY